MTTTLHAPRLAGNAGPGRPAPRPRPHPDADRRRRYALLAASDANRCGHRLLDAARDLLAIIDEFEGEAADRAALARTLIAAGFAPVDPDVDKYGADYFAPAAADAAGCRYNLELFVSLLECGLLRRPADLDASAGDRPGKAVPR